MLFSYLFLWLPCFLPPFTVTCEMVLAWPDERETWPYQCSLRLFTMVRSSCGPIACWILARTSSLVTWDTWYLAVAPHFRGLHSSLELCCEGPWFTSIQEDGCDKGAHQSYLELREILLSFKTSFNLVNAAVVCAIPIWNVKYEKVSFVLLMIACVSWLVYLCFFFYFILFVRTLLFWIENNAKPCMFN